MKKALMRMLTMQVDKFATHLGELSKGRQIAIDIRPRTPLHRNHAAQDDLIVTHHKPALYPRLIATMTHHRDVAFPTHKQVNGFNHHGLARTSFTRESSKPIFKDKGDGVDNA